MRVAGLGFRTSATVASLRDALERAGGQVDRLATDAEKAKTPAFVAFAAECGLPLVPVGQDQLAMQVTETQSAQVIARFGTGSLAEAAALAAAGPRARLVQARVISSDGLATAAIAEGDGI